MVEISKDLANSSRDIPYNSRKTETYLTSLNTFDLLESYEWRSTRGAPKFSVSLLRLFSRKVIDLDLPARAFPANF